MRIGRTCLYLTGLVLVGASCPVAAESEVRFQGGDGLTQKTAVVIVGARNEAEGIAAERMWTARQHPAWRKASQGLFGADHRSFDVITYDAPDGPHTVWFDITDFFGKF